MMVEDGKAETTGIKKDGNFITVKGRSTPVSGTPFDYWIKYDITSKKIVDYGPK